MKKHMIIIPAFGLALSSYPTLNAETNDLTICHIANAGFYAESGGIGVLIDAVMQRNAYEGRFALPSANTLKNITESKTRFSNVKLALATHIHADHFDATASVAHMKASPNVTYLVTPKAFDALSASGAGDEISQAQPVNHSGNAPMEIKQHGMTIEVYKVDHGEKAPTNFGYKVTFPTGRSIFHTGDITASLERLNKHGLDKTETDVLMLPFWYLLQNAANVSAAWQAKTIIPTHFMAKEQNWMAEHGGMEGVKQKAKSFFPEKSILIDKEMQCETL